MDPEGIMVFNHLRLSSFGCAAAWAAVAEGTSLAALRVGNRFELSSQYLLHECVEIRFCLNHVL